MKKILSVILAALMLFSMTAIGVSAEETDELVVAVANDLHFSKQFEGKTFSKDYGNAVGTGQLRIESEAIIDEFLKQIAASDAEVVLIPGDITDNGYKTEHISMAAKFADFEAQTGKEVFVIPGNHDYMQHRTSDASQKITVEDFRIIYADSGYAQAIAHDTATASYVADLNDEYRILAIDATKPGNVQNLNEELYNWIEAQAIQAQKDGKKLMAMSHYNLLEHLVMVEVIHPGSVLTASLELPELFAKYNIKYNFVGHTHDHDIKAYVASNGNTIYDVLTSTINAYPCPYRMVRFGEEVKIETKFIDSIDTACLKGKVTDATYNQATEDFPAYAKDLFAAGLVDVVDSYVKPAKIKSLLKLDATEDAELCALLDSIVPKLNDVIHMPLYKAYETEEGKSVESIVAMYNMTVPASDYENIIDLAIDVYLAHIIGDESIGVLSTDFSIVTTCFTAMFNYALEDVTGEQYAQVMSIACSFLGAEVPVDFFKYAGSGLKKAEGIDIFITAVLTPVLLEITTDEGTPDNNVTLEGYGAQYEEPAELAFWEKIVKFFKDALAYLVRILGF